VAREVFRTDREWGVRSFMIDFVHAASGSTPGRFLPDGYFDKSHVPSVEAIRSARDVIRRAADPGTSLLVSTGPLFPTVGLLDAVGVISPRLPIRTAGTSPFLPIGGSPPGPGGTEKTSEATARWRLDPASAALCLGGELPQSPTFPWCTGGPPGLAVRGSAWRRRARRTCLPF
jgi:hypothetical protein